MLEASGNTALSCPTLNSAVPLWTRKEGERYLAAMACAANFAFVNRQVITHWVRESFEQVFQLGSQRPPAATWSMTCATTWPRWKPTMSKGRKGVSACTEKELHAPSPRAIRNPFGLSERGAACPHPRRHGTLFLRPGGNGPGL
jgi:hypothetical protein